MPIEIERKSDRLNVNIVCHNIGSDEEALKTFDQLDEAIEIIATHLNERDIYFFGIKIHCKRSLLSRMLSVFGRSSGRKYALNAAAEFKQKWVRSSESQFNPWDAVCPDFWIHVLSNETLRGRAKAYLSKLENLLTVANQYGRSTDSLWEHDEIQFGEPLVTLLAMQDLEFVPYYSRLLQQWDMGSEVKQIDEIKQIVLKYGVCDEVVDLLYHRAYDLDAQWHADQITELMPILNSRSKNFYEAATFERIISAFHLSDYFMRQEAFKKYKNEIEVFNAQVEKYNNRTNLEETDEKPYCPSIPNLIIRWNVFENCDDNQLKSAAEKVLVKFEKSHPEPDFNSVHVATIINN